MDSSFDRPYRALQWAQKTFGDIALDPRERTLRFLEEAIEVANAMGIEPETVQAVVTRTYERHQGAINREIGQAQLTLELLSKVLKVDQDHEATEEFYRIQKVPQAEWERRHAAKVALGIAR